MANPDGQSPSQQRRPTLNITLRKIGGTWTVVQRSGNESPPEGMSLRPRRMMSYQMDNEGYLGEIRPGHYVVQDIEGHKTLDGTTKYFVKWLSYPPTGNTWEPISSFENCQHFVHKYERKLLEQGRQITDTFHFIYEYYTTRR